MRLQRRVSIIGLLLVATSAASLLYLSLHLQDSAELPVMSNHLLHQTQQVANQVDGLSRLVQFLQRIIAQ